MLHTLSTALTPRRRRLVGVLLVVFGLPDAYETVTANAFWWSDLVPSIWPWLLIAAGIILLTVDLWWPVLLHRSQPDTGAGRTLGSLTVESWHRANPASGRYTISTAFKGEAARVLQATDQKVVPKALVFDKPRESTYFRAADLPKKMRWRDGLHRHSVEITRFLPGGVVLDEQGAPAGMPLQVTLYYDTTALPPP